MCQPLFNVGSGLNCVSGGPTRLMNIRLDKITVNNWSIQKKQWERSCCIKKNGNGIPMRSRLTRILVPVNILPNFLGFLLHSIEIRRCSCCVNLFLTVTLFTLLRFLYSLYTSLFLDAIQQFQSRFFYGSAAVALC